MRQSISRRASVLFTIALCVSAVRAQGLATGFTYQGRLDAGGSPAAGLTDLKFTLWDSDVGGNPLGTVTYDGGDPSLPVQDLVDGLFSVELDFGVGPFDGGDRYLEIAVRRPAGSGSYTTLSPRQRVAPTPYALQTRGLFVDDAGNAGIGTAAPVDKLHVDGSAVFKGPRPWVDVRAYGATGDGVTDDTLAIQNAIDSLTYGGTVFFPEGVYWLTSSSGVPAIAVTTPALVLQGAGLGSQLINHGEGDLLQIGDGINYFSNVVVDSLSFNGGVETGWNINVRHAPNTRIVRSSISKSSQSTGGISFNYSWCSTVTNCLVGNTLGTGILIGNTSSGVWIDGNRIEGTGPTDPGTGVLIAGSHSVHLAGNTIEAWENGIDFNGASGVSIDGCYFEGTDTAIRNVCGGVWGLHVSGCFFGGPRAGSEADIDLANIIGAVIQGNTFKGTHGADAPIRITGGGVTDSIIGPNHFVDVRQVSVCNASGGCPFIFDCSTPNLPTAASVTIYTPDGIGIGKNDPSERLDVEGNIKASGAITSVAIRAENPGELAVSAVRGISATATDAENLRGAETFGSADTTTVTFSTAEADASYFVTVTGNANETFWIENKLNTGFTIRSSNASSTATVDWMLIR